MNDPTTPQQLVSAARKLLSIPHGGALYVRGAAILARQGLEAAIDDFWRKRSLPAMVDAARANQLICLPSYLPLEHKGIALRVSYLWTSLSGYAHHHPYELTVLPVELAPIVDQVAAVVGELGEVFAVD